MPDVLQAYTQHQRVVELDAPDIGALFHSLDDRFPGLRFRVINELDELRPHIKVFVNQELVRDLARTLTPGDEVMIVQALSGG